MNTSLFDEQYENFDFKAPDAQILIVDDNHVNLTVAEGLLGPMEMQIDTAISGKSALEMINKKKYDLILMDHMMPELDGIETTRLIRRFHSEYSDVPIIALTANAVSGMKETFLQEGMNDFVAKPIELKIILKKLKYWLPKEKIIKVRSDDYEINDKKDKWEFDIPGLEIDYAAKMLGSEILFWNVLKDYYKTIEKSASIIEESYKQKDWPRYTIEVHALKSASKQIGAIELSELAAALEAAGNVRDTEMINNHTQELLDLYRSYREKLKPYLDVEEEKTNEEKEDIDNQGLIGFFNELEEASEDLDMDRMAQVIDKMDNYKFDETQSEIFEELKVAVEDIDVEKCEDLIDEWRKYLC